jgi:hypothetical protein
LSSLSAEITELVEPRRAPVAAGDASPAAVLGDVVAAVVAVAVGVVVGAAAPALFVDVSDRAEPLCCCFSCDTRGDLPMLDCRVSGAVDADDALLGRLGLARALAGLASPTAASAASTPEGVFASDGGPSWR